MSSPTPAPPLTREQQKQRTREEIRRAALDLFETHGFDRTTIDEVAAEAGVGRRTFFRYFPSKEAVLFSSNVFEFLADDFDEGLRAGLPPMRALLAAIDKDAYGSESPDQTTIRRRRLRRELLSEPSVAAFYRDQIDRLVVTVIGVLREHPSHAELRHFPELVAGVLRAMVMEHLESGETHHFTADGAGWRVAVERLAASF